MIPALLSLLLAAPLSAAQTPAPSPEAPAEEDLPPLLKEPQLLEFVQAPYPEEAKAAGVEGSVMLLIEIDETGKVSNVEVLDGPGYGFEEAALEAAWKFQFSPAEDETGPVPVAEEFAYGFVLDAGSREDAVPEPADSAEAAPAAVNLEGTLLEMGTRRALAGFAVRVEPLGLEVSTDAEGHFAFAGVPNGAVTVTAVHPGYDRVSKDVALVEGEATVLKLWIRNQDYRDDDLIGVYQRETEDVTRRTITVEEVRRIPGTFGDPVRVIQNLPGAARSPFGTGLLVIRGANPEDSAVYVDGIRVPLIYHLGGFRSVISPDIIEAVDYLPGGYGVEYGRTLGGVVDVRTKTTYPDQVRAVWNTNLLDSGALIEGKAGKNDQIGFAAAARRSYIDLFIPYFTREASFTIKPRWYDYQLKVQALNLDQGKLSGFLFGFQDVLYASTPGINQGTDQDTQGDLGTAYSTHRLVAEWERPLSQKLALRVVPSIGIDGANFTLGNDFRLNQTVVLLELRAELPWTASDALTLTPGVDFLGGFYNFSTELPFNPELFADFDPLAEREPYTLDGNGTAWGPDAYLEAAWRPLPERDRLLIKPGVRANYVNILNQLNVASIEPRLAVRWSPLEKSTIKLGGGLYHQPPQPFEAYRPEGTVKLGYERAWSSEVGWEQQVSQAISADATVFYKWLDHLIVDNPTFTTLDDDFFVNEGVGEAYGAEFMLRHALVDRFFGWVSYTLSRSTRLDHPEANDDWYLFDLDQTHILTAVAGYRLPYDFEISGKFQYVTGNPYTPYSGGVYDIDQDFYFGYATGDYNSERLPPYVAGDLRVDKLFTFKSWQLELFVDLLNAVRGQNPEFVLDNYDYTETRYIRGLPFIPSPGFQAEFHL